MNCEQGLEWQGASLVSMACSTANLLHEAKMISEVETQKLSTAVEASEVSVPCFCCGLTEECTLSYIDHIRERYRGRWICGLCSEAVKDETLRSQGNITTDEAFKRHMKFCQQFRSSSPPLNPAEDLILAMKQLLRRSFESPRKRDLTCRPLARAKSCFSSVSEMQTGAHKD